MSGDRASTSKLIALVLRHKPEVIGLALDDRGWADCDALLAGLAAQGHALSRADLFDLVTTNPKKRFTLSVDGQQIRAAQGHSLSVALGLTPIAPPETLYHGTAIEKLEAILVEGLRPMARQHVHLSAECETARKVGQRHGKPIVLRVAAGRMHDAGLLFYQAENGVWLTDFVPPGYIANTTE